MEFVGNNTNKSMEPPPLMTWKTVTETHDYDR